MSWATNNPPRSSTQMSSPSAGARTSNVPSGWGAQSSGGGTPTQSRTPPSTSQQSPSSNAVSPVNRTSSVPSGWGAQTGAPRSGPTSPSSSSSNLSGRNPSASSPSLTTGSSAPSGWGAQTGQRPGTGQDRHATGGASSWGVQSGVGGRPGGGGSTRGACNITQNERTFADDVLDAGNEAYEAYVDQMREREAATPEVTTQRMLRLAQETTDIADRTISTLELQSEELARQQQDVADLNDDLNTAEKKMRAIKSGWGGFVNLGSAKKHNQHSKQLDKWGKSYENEQQKSLAAQQKEDYEQGKINLKNNEKLIGETTEGFSDEQHLAKKSSRMESKGIAKGNVAQRDETVNFGGFIFEERVEGCGPKHQAESDLEQLSLYTQGLRQRADRQADLTVRTSEQINYINDGVAKANNRSQNLNDGMNKYIKKG